jgi:dihydropteroate synthase
VIVGSRDFDFDRRVYVMGILNVTPDSFSDGGKFLDPEAALDRALRMQEEGADLIDVGAESTRPGASPVPAEEEVRRLVPVLKKILPRLKAPVSVDTRKTRVAEAALAEGAAMINDVSALEGAGMAELAARRGVPVILMHKKGEPKTMQDDPSYGDVVAEVFSYLEGRIRFAVERGVGREKILVDPGIGFGKRPGDNWEILRNLGAFRSLGCPIVVGASRKSLVHGTLGGSLAAALLAALGGAAVLRVHDVGATKELILRAGRG